MRIKIKPLGSPDPPIRTLEYLKQRGTTVDLWDAKDDQGELVDPDGTIYVCECYIVEGENEVLVARIDPEALERVLVGKWVEGAFEERDKHELGFYMKDYRLYLPTYAKLTLELTEYANRTFTIQPWEAGEHLGSAIEPTAERLGNGKMIKEWDDDQKIGPGDYCVHVYHDSAELGPSYTLSTKFEQIGQSEASTWRGWWWPFRNSGGPRLYDIEAAHWKYDLYNGLPRQNPTPRENEEAAANWEWRRFDLQVYNETGEETGHHSEPGDGLALWSGHCHAWAAAACLEPEPTEARVFEDFFGPGENLEFSVGDLKGLLSGAHYSFRPADTWGEGNATKCPDADGMHRMLRNYLRAEEKALMFERDPGEPIWWHPCWKYVAHMEGKSFDALRRVDVTTTVYLREAHNDPSYVTQGPEDSLPLPILYELEYDALGDPISGTFPPDWDGSPDGLLLPSHVNLQGCGGRVDLGTVENIIEGVAP